jgi:hypothetical protein
LDTDWLESDEPPVENYLYQYGEKSQPVFAGIHQDMAQLNDFCVLCVEGTSKRLADLRELARRLRTGEERIELPDLGDVSGETLDGLGDVAIPGWQETEQFIVRAMILLLLSAFTEKCLKDMAQFLAQPGAPPFRRKGGGSDIAGLLKYLRESCGLKFDEPEASRAIRERCRRIRNDFAHGRWDEVKAGVAGESLRNAFGAVTVLFNAIDAASAIES